MSKYIHYTSNVVRDIITDVVMTVAFAGDVPVNFNQGLSDMTFGTADMTFGSADMTWGY